MQIVLSSSLWNKNIHFKDSVTHGWFSINKYFDYLQVIIGHIPYVSA
jgi:hypothetical protein